MLKVSVIAAVALMEPVDMSIIDLAFPVSYTHDATKIEFDVYESSKAIAVKGNFAKQAKVVDKGGYKTVTVNPMEVNESIVDTPKNAGRKRIGMTKYGELSGGMTEAQIMEIEDDAEGFKKLKERKLRLVKKSAYDVLTTGIVIVSGEGEAVDSIDFGLTNKIVNDNATAGQYQWYDTTNSDPIQQLETEAVAMKHYAVDTFVLGFEAKKAFLAHPKVRRSDNVTTGQSKNFYEPTDAERMAKSTETFLYLGRTSGEHGKPLEIYAEIDTYETTGGDVYYLDKNYAVGFRKGNEANAQLHYGAIPVSTGDGENVKIELVQQEEWIDGEIQKNPAGIARYYKSSPLPTMNNPKAFISIKATLIA